MGRIRAEAAKAAQTAAQTPAAPDGTVCPSCGASAAPGVKFCPECGAPLSRQSE
ncbi:zinc-ribbon domain-containing protein [Phocea massiliensis]|uniref:Zinc-ribbon domain-containing protein n=1 Tax=Merdimmobilis hominis TaxID=2897707 RepID=A0A939BFI5_9FIRM|nr:zinc-ribbon domain-containing protein [Merdimmobilis hominis]